MHTFFQGQGLLEHMGAGPPGNLKWLITWRAPPGEGRPCGPAPISTLAPRQRQGEDQTPSAWAEHCFPVSAGPASGALAVAVTQQLVLKAPVLWAKCAAVAMLKFWGMLFLHSWFVSEGGGMEEQVQGTEALAPCCPASCNRKKENALHFSTLNSTSPLLFEPGAGIGEAERMAGPLQETCLHA